MFYDRFIKLCEKKGVSPSTVAKEIGLSNSATTYWKRGSSPKADTIQKLADYFNVSIDYLLGVVDENGFLTPEGFGDPEDYEFIKMLGLDDPQNRRNINSANSPKALVLAAMDQLNAAGQQKAVERVEELTEIPKYQKEPPQD